MEKAKIVLERNLNNQRRELLLQQLFNAVNVPANLIGVERGFQEESIKQGFESNINLNASFVARCEMQIGNIHCDLRNLDEEKVTKYLEAIRQGKEEDNNQESGHINWQFKGANQFGSVTVSVRNRTWQVEFSRLQRRISSLITTEDSLKPKAHQVLYEEMKQALQPIAAFDPSQMLFLQGASGLGKTHCAEHYFYHEAHKHHQMVAWLSGVSEDALLKDWEALANQLRHIDGKKREYSNEAIIRHWCEEQLGQWLFIIDDMQVEPEWLKQYLPQKGGHVLITTSKTSYSLPKEA
ncbi:MAG: hypothetical protein K2X39_02975, partial [Silvanigrellaceae bacterium]|nr:hypothetical protein [Silvanigrellaceae bacterium]